MAHECRRLPGPSRGSRGGRVGSPLPSFPGRLRFHYTEPATVASPPPFLSSPKPTGAPETHMRVARPRQEPQPPARHLRRRPPPRLPGSCFPFRCSCCSSPGPDPLSAAAKSRPEGRPGGSHQGLNFLNFLDCLLSFPPQGASPCEEDALAGWAQGRARGPPSALPPACCRPASPAPGGWGGTSTRYRVALGGLVGENRDGHVHLKWPVQGG